MRGLFAATIFLAACLLFAVEPMVGKMLLPLLGGTSAVWTACLVFFQGALLLGYLFALVSLRIFGPKWQPLVEVLLVASAVALLPISIDLTASERFAHLPPTAHAFALLTARVGLPFFALSTIAPTLQRWFSTATEGRANPYALYAASNLGSLGTLLAYPILAEPRLGLRAQAGLLRSGHLLLIGLLAFCAIRTLRAPSGEAAAASDGHVSIRRRIRWGVLSFIPSAYLVAVTTHVTTEVTPTPLLWTLPLAVYLLSFVLVFAEPNPISHTFVIRYFPLPAALVAYALGTSANDPVFFVVALHLVAFFGACMLCHGELVRDRPPPRRLTEFYVFMSAGGFVGGVVVGLVLPLVTTRLVEYPICLLLALLVRPNDDPLRPRDALAPLAVLLTTAGIGLVLERAASGTILAKVLAALPLLAAYGTLSRPFRFAGVISAFLVGAVFLPNPLGRVIHRERNFFGALAVSYDATGRWVQIAHGTTIHGLQARDAAGRKEPRAYFTRTGPIGEIFDEYVPNATNRHVGVIGLGAGAMAAFRSEGFDWTFFELNPAVVRIAKDPRYFTYLEDAFPRGDGLAIVLGDARLELARRDDTFGLFVVDAFSSDSIPTHLITREAAELYLSKLSADGLLAWHISNRSLDLRPVLAEVANDLSIHAYVAEHLVSGEADGLEGKWSSMWVAMARTETRLVALARRDSRWGPLVRKPDFRPFTDDRSSIFTVLGR